MATIPDNFYSDISKSTKDNGIKWLTKNLIIFITLEKLLTWLNSIFVTLQKKRMKTSCMYTRTQFVFGDTVGIHFLPSSCRGAERSTAMYMYAS